MNENTNNEAPNGRPSLSIYKPNAKGTGAAIRLTLHPAHDDTDGSIMMSVANQMTIGNRMGPNPTFPRFDWENKATVRLGFDDLSRFLQVLRGECEEINEGKGIWHRSPVGETIIRFRHILDPISGYDLELFRRKNNEDYEMRYHFLMTPNEAIGICEAITQAMMFVAFGIPAVINQ